MEDYVVYDEIGRSANTTVYKGRKTVWWQIEFGRGRG